jgi:hypothetical protein
VLAESQRENAYQFECTVASHFADRQLLMGSL